MLLTPARSRVKRAAWLATGVAVVTFLQSEQARATPRTLPFSYAYETLAQGEAEVEQYVDVTPVKALSTSSGKPSWVGLFSFQTELELGLTDHLELGLYAVVTPGAGDGFVGAGTLAGSGAKQRLRWRLFEEGELPVDLSLYAEVVETATEIELEGKWDLQKRFGNLRAIANLWAEHEFYFDGHREWVLNPTLGMSYQVSPTFQPGFEAWSRTELPTSPPPIRAFGLGPHVYVGPTLLLNLGKIWWSNGFYLRVSDAARSVAAGDAFGRVWVRSVVGVNL